jgi:hypothetical protein
MMMGLTAPIGNETTRLMFRGAQERFDLSARLPHSSRLISGLSYKTAFKSELWTSIVPL